MLDTTTPDHMKQGFLGRKVTMTAIMVVFSSIGKDRVLNLANTIFEGIKMGAKVTHNQLASTNRTSKSITLHQDPMPLRMIVFKHLPMLQKRMAENMSLVTLQSHEH
jgi:hypothetical protein